MATKDMDQKTSDVDEKVATIQQDVDTRFEESNVKSDKKKFSVFGLKRYHDQKRQELEDRLAVIDQDVDTRFKDMGKKTSDVEKKVAAIQQDITTCFKDSDKKTSDVEEIVAAFQQDMNTRFKDMDKNTSDFEEKVAAIQQDMNTRFKDFMDQTRQDYKDRLGAIDQDVKNRLQDFMDQQKQKMETRLAAIDQGVENRFQALASRNNQTLTELATMKASLVEVFKKANQASVAFSAHGVINDDVDIGQTVLFQSLQLNMGDGFDLSSGKFTAPVRGTYIFMAQLNAAHYCGVAGQIIARGRFSSSRRYIGRSWGKSHEASAVTVLGVDQLAKGDQVWIDCYQRATWNDNPSILHAGFGESSFRGVLIHT